MVCKLMSGNSFAGTHPSCGRRRAPQKWRDALSTIACTVRLSPLTLAFTREMRKSLRAMCPPVGSFLLPRLAMLEATPLGAITRTQPVPADACPLHGMRCRRAVGSLEHRRARYVNRCGCGSHSDNPGTGMPMDRCAQAGDGGRCAPDAWAVGRQHGRLRIGRAVEYCV